MLKLNQLVQLVLIFILFAHMGKCNFSHARQVKEVKLVSNGKEFAVEGDSSFSLPKKIVDSVPNAAQAKEHAKIGGRKMSTEETNTSRNKTTSKAQRGRDNKKVSNIGDHKENWKENIMAFSADYRSPKSHPPKNN